jgi:hypothetical protein
MGEGANGEPRPSSKNLIPDTDEPYVSAELRDDADPGGHLERLLAHPDAKAGSGAFEIDVETLRGLGLTVRYEPEYGDRHFGIYGLTELPSKTAIGIARKAIFRARLLRHPTLSG